MIDIFHAVFDPDNLFLKYAFIMGALASVAFGIIGTFVTTKRIGYLAGAISHSIFGGIGLALFLQVNAGITWFDPILGAVLAAIISAVTIGLVSLYAKEREDTIIGTIWAVGMASGILLIDKTPGYFNLASYLFGDILLISGKDLLYVACLDTLVLGICLLFFNRFFGICFDSEFTSLRGINTTFFYLLLLILTALTVVFLVRIVGIVLVIALLTIPPAIASFYAKRLWQMMLYSILLCGFFTWAGLGISYSWSLSSGPTIIVLSGGAYIILLIIHKVLRT
ncbi:MAG: metal ABC transporter permease [Proteobacteria bacterium]|nr:metal ABC transporter permease [Pseudomonadota bacterium]MBU1583157.1 metal ABC transporter permease [Pseudomonadota bacterium]MBU2452934.1 metal ABC transporter permease [Pseudomonadota bacterium]MBU2627524.1 metal ABC transporter permease [Pseudomonadota bacterium]